MATYTMQCDQGHESETLTVEADTEEEAVQKMMEKSRTHNVEKHSGQISEEQMEQMIRSSMQKA